MAQDAEGEIPEGEGAVAQSWESLKLEARLVREILEGEENFFGTGTSES
jgi:hypothetical protein